MKVDDHGHCVNIKVHKVRMYPLILWPIILQIAFYNEGKKLLRSPSVCVTDSLIFKYQLAGKTSALAYDGIIITNLLF